MTHAKNNAWFDRARAARSIVPIARFVPESEHVFALKPSGYGRLFSLAGVDEESLTDQEIGSVLRNIEGALRGLPEGSALYQYMSASAAPAIPRQQSYAQPRHRIVRERPAQLFRGSCGLPPDNALLVSDRRALARESI